MAIWVPWSGVSWWFSVWGLGDSLSAGGSMDSRQMPPAQRCDGTSALLPCWRGWRSCMFLLSAVSHASSLLYLSSPITKQESDCGSLCASTSSLPADWDTVLHTLCHFTFPMDTLIIREINLRCCDLKYHWSLEDALSPTEASWNWMIQLLFMESKCAERFFFLS